MTESEAVYAGATLHYWPDQASVTNNRPWILVVQRAEILDPGGPNEETQLHGRVLGNEPWGDFPYGEPHDVSSYPFGPITLALVPTAEQATVRASVTTAYASVGRVDANYDLGLAAGTWEILDGGAAALASGIAYDDQTGEITIAAGGIYRVSLTVTAQRGGILTTNADAAVFVDGVQSSMIGSTPLEILSAYSIAASDVIDLGDGAVLTARVRSSLALTLTASRWTLALDQVRS